MKSKRKKMAKKNTEVLTIKSAIDQIDKMYGKGTIYIYGKGINSNVNSVSTSSLGLNSAIGIGGVPRGRVTEIFGPESSGKTTLCLHIIAEAQKKNEDCAFIDVEHALDINYARKLGVNVDKLLMSQPDSAEQALEIAQTLIDTKKLAVVVMDSVAALVPQSEIEGGMGDASMAVQARLMSQAMRKLTGKISKSGTAMIFINQIRKKIGVMFGNPEVTSGGGALKFYASVRLDIRRIAAIKKGDDVIGNRTKVKVVKNKVDSPFREVQFDILYGVGIDKYGEMAELAIKYNIVDQKGQWIYLKTKKKEHKFQGREKFKNAIIKNDKLYKYIIKQLTGD